MRDNPNPNKQMSSIVEMMPARIVPYVVSEEGAQNKGRSNICWAILMHLVGWKCSTRWNDGLSADWGGESNHVLAATGGCSRTYRVNTKSLNFHQVSTHVNDVVT